MIAQDQILNLINKYQTVEGNILREYFQHLFLLFFYQQPQSSNIFFKGGTALRFVYKSPRFSEDLDFSANLSGSEEIEQALLQTLDSIEKEGIPTNLQEAKTTTGGYLAAIIFQKDPGIAIRLEISLRQGEKRGELVAIINDFIPEYTIVGLEKDQLIDEKIQALLNRKKPRDFYDLYFILRANLLPLQKRNVLPQALEALKTTHFNFELELKQFLPKSHWAIIRDFRNTLEKEIQRFRA